MARLIAIALKGEEKVIMPEERKWAIWIEDENGATKCLSGDSYYTGTYGEVVPIAERLADEWEVKTGGLVLKLTLESHGKVK